MQRCASASRQDWQTIVQSQGMHYHTVDGQPYWDESAYYAFTSAEIDQIEKATYDLNEMCLKAVEHVIEEQLLAQFGIPPEFGDFVRRSWEQDEQTIYGRFDFSYDGTEPPKLLEYNADTPTALLEASVIQWFWLKQVQPQADQFNSIHERLIEAWKALKEKRARRVHFASLRGNLEDYMTVNYLRDTAMQGGLETEFLHVEDIGWNQRQSAFVDLHEQLDCRPLQALSVGMDDEGSVRRPSYRLPNALAGAALENDSEQQGDSCRALGSVPRKSLLAAVVIRAVRHYIRQEADAGAGRVQRHAGLRRQTNRGNGRDVWRGSVDLSGRTSAAEVRRQLPGNWQLDRERLRLRHGDS